MPIEISQSLRVDASERANLLYVVFEREARESHFHRLLSLTRIAYISQNNCLHNPEHSLVPLTRNKAFEYVPLTCNNAFEYEF